MRGREVLAGIGLSIAAATTAGACASGGGDALPNPEFTTTTTTPAHLACRNALSKLVMEGNEAIVAGDTFTASQKFSGALDRKADCGEYGDDYFSRPDNAISAYMSDREGYERVYPTVHSLMTAVYDTDPATEATEEAVNSLATQVRTLRPGSYEYFKEEVDQLYSEVANEAAEAGSTDEAFGVLAKMDNEGTFDRDSARDHVEYRLITFAKDVARNGDLQAADAIVGRIDNEGTWTKEGARDDIDYVRYDRAKTAALQGNFEEAEKLIAGIDTRGTWTKEDARDEVDYAHYAAAEEAALNNNEAEARKHIAAMDKKGTWTQTDAKRNVDEILARFK